ncbi:hypothetical protein KM043_014141 [Ampulex compressa]|nr:hypothetical protein KM043_014141 [Ampulex compressa]
MLQIYIASIEKKLVQHGCAKKTPNENHGSIRHSHKVANVGAEKKGVEPGCARGIPNENHGSEVRQGVGPYGSRGALDQREEPCAPLREPPLNVAEMLVAKRRPFFRRACRRRESCSSAR